MGKSKVASRKKTSSKRQKVNKMKRHLKKTRKNYLGGSSILGADINLAYTGNNVPTVPNPFLAYTGKGGGNIPININSMDKTVPNTGPPSDGYNFINPQGLQRGGCGCGIPLMNGGSFMKGGNCPSCSMNGGGKKKGGCGPLCLPGLMVGGKRHRLACKCSSCKMKGGNVNNGLVGQAWTPAIGGWPGVTGDGNYYPVNDYKPDISRQMIDVGANPPFSIGGKGRTRKQRGGAFSNFLGQDLINLGRQFQFGLGGAYNALAGHASPVNPMPWKDQLPNSTSLNTMRADSI